MVSLLIFSLLVISLYSLYSQILLTHRLSQEMDIDTLVLRIFQLRLMQELFSAFYNPKKAEEYSFKGDSSQFSFLIASPSLYFAKNPLTHVEYFLQGDKIMRKEYRFLSLDEETQEYPVLSGIKEWKVTYLSREGWKEEWEDKDSLPICLKIAIELEKGGRFQTSFYIPLSKTYGEE